MTFDWAGFLNLHAIPYTTRAHNLSRGNLGVACPFCDWSDKSPETWRMGISTAGKGWSCWHNAEHSGVRPHRLVQAFLKCSWAEALRIVGDDGQAMPAIDDRSFGDVISSMMYDSVAPKAMVATTLSLAAAGLVPLNYPRAKAHQLCHKYLYERKYTYDEAAKIMKYYDLRCTLSGPFRYRIIFPIEHPEGLVSWQGRTVLKTDELRYKALSADPEKAKAEGMPLARLSIHKTLWRAKQLFEMPDDTLVVCEGPFDALRVDFYGAHLGVRATCLFGKSMSDEQAVLLSDIAPLYRRRILMLDEDAIMDGLRIQDRLDFLRFETLSTPKAVKDPGELSRAQVRALFTH